jgi:hypothetical protein
VTQVVEAHPRELGPPTCGVPEVAWGQSPLPCGT